MIEIDGSYGEGGGQVLRTALTLSTITGQPVRLRRIRAGRRNPGLQPQHLMGVLALARICRAEVRGAALKSSELEFHPQTEPAPGEYEFDVARVSSGGSAGSVVLLAQALLLPLALAPEGSRLTLRGGTHVPASPSYHYLAHVYLPTLARMGVRAGVRLDDWGFYPVGGGQLSVEINPAAGLTSSGQRPGPKSGSASQPLLSPLALLERGAMRRVWGIGVAANLPAHIPQRIATRAKSVLAGASLRADIQPLRERAAGPGAGLFIVAESDHALAGFSSIGEKGKPSEQVAEEAALDLIAHLGTEAAVDMHLADQLLLPMALAGGRSQFRVCRLSQHLLTNAHIIQHFLTGVKFDVDGAENEAATVAVSPMAQPGPE